MNCRSKFGRKTAVEKRKCTGHWLGLNLCLHSYCHKLGPAGTSLCWIDHRRMLSTMIPTTEVNCDGTAKYHDASAIKWNVQPLSTCDIAEWVLEIPIRGSLALCLALIVHSDGAIRFDQICRKFRAAGEGEIQIQCRVVDALSGTDLIVFSC